MLTDDTFSPSADSITAAADTLSTAVAHQTPSHRIDLESAYRVNARGVATGHGKARMLYQRECIGESHQPAFDAARYLLATTLRSGKDSARDAKAPEAAVTEGAHQ